MDIYKKMVQQQDKLRSVEGKYFEALDENKPEAVLRGISCELVELRMNCKLWEQAVYAPVSLC